MNRALPSGGRGHRECDLNGVRSKRNVFDIYKEVRNTIQFNCDFHVAPVAQLDRALPSGGRGQRFESSRVRHLLSLMAFLRCSLVSILLR